MEPEVVIICLPTSEVKRAPPPADIILSNTSECVVSLGTGLGKGVAFCNVLISLATAAVRAPKDQRQPDQSELSSRGGMTELSAHDQEILKQIFSQGNKIATAMDIVDY